MYLEVLHLQKGWPFILPIKRFKKSYSIKNEPEDTEKYIQRLDRKLTVSKMSSESRNGGIKIGKRYLTIVQYLISAIGASTVCSLD